MKTLLLFLMLPFLGLSQIGKNNLQDSAKKEEINLTSQEENLLKKPSVLKRYDDGEPDITYDFQYGSFSFAGEQWNGKCDTNHFTFYFNNIDSTTPSSVEEVGSYYEHVRSTFLVYGFREPIHESGYNKIRVGLSQVYGGAVTQPVGNGKTCSSYIINYSFNGHPNYNFKTGIAHEYFHAIQNAYNYYMGWFKEASADWASTFMLKNKADINGNISKFITDNPCLTNTDYKYGTSIFPITLVQKYGVLIMRRILEGFGDLPWYNYNYSDSKFKDIINTALSEFGNDTFDTILHAVHTNTINPTKWYNLEDFQANSWAKRAPTRVVTVTETSINSTVTGTVKKGSAQLIKFTMPSDMNGDITYQISFGNSNCISSQYYANAGTTNDVISNRRAGLSSGQFVSCGKNRYELVGLVLTNPNLDNDTNFTITYSIRLTNISLSFNNNTRIIEQRMYIPEGSYSELTVTFAYAGYKIIQTLGTLDTKIAIYRNNSLINNVQSCDDKGYYANAWYSLSAQANVEYKIRVSCFNPASSGFTRLVIIPQRTESYLVPMQFNDIFVDTEPFYLNDTVTEKALRLEVFRPSESRNYTLTLESDFDNYLYVFDAASDALGVRGIDFDDDSGGNSNARITRYLDKSKTYLIIFGQYNPSRSLATVNPTIYLDIE